MALLRIVILASLAVVSLAGIDHARARDLTCNNASLPSARPPDEGEDFVGAGGPGSGGDARGVLAPTLALKLCGGVTGALRPSAAAAWFSALAPGDRRKFMREAGKVGVVDRDGNPFDVAQFEEMARYFDEAMTRQGMSDGAKLKLLRMMAEDAGIPAAKEAETHDVHGG